MKEEKKEDLAPLAGEIKTLIAGIFPTTQFFESRFQLLQLQIDELRRNQEGFKEQLRDFKQDVDKRFEQVDKRFEQVDKRFERLEIRMQSVEDKIDRLIERIDSKVDSGLQETRTLTIRLFTFAMTFAAISVVGMVGRIFGLY